MILLPKRRAYQVAKPARDHQVKSILRRCICGDTHRPSSHNIGYMRCSNPSFSSDTMNCCCCSLLFYSPSIQTAGYNAVCQVFCLQRLIYINKNTRIPGITVHCTYCKNPTELFLIVDNQHAIASLRSHELSGLNDQRVLLHR